MIQIKEGKTYLMKIPYFRKSFPVNVCQVCDNYVHGSVAQGHQDEGEEFMMPILAIVVVREIEPSQPENNGAEL